MRVAFFQMLPSQIVLQCCHARATTQRYHTRTSQQSLWSDLESATRPRPIQYATKRRC